MAILTDQEFMDAVERTPKIIPRSLWQHLNEIAQYLALIGDVEAAYDVWKFAYQDIPYVPERYSEYGDSSVAALCHYLKHEDISRGLPTADAVKPGDSLEERIRSFDSLSRRRKTMDRWSPLATNDGIELMRSGCTLVRPRKGEIFSSTELEALPVFESFVAHPLSQHQPTARLDAFLLSADIAARHGQEARAIAFLHQWCKTATSLNTMLDMVLSLNAVATLAFNGALANTSPMTKQERRELVDTLLSPASAAGSYLLNPYKVPTEITIWPDHSTLSFEPSWDEEPEEEWHLSKNEPLIHFQPDQPYPIVVYLTTPWDTGNCIISIDMTNQPPDWNEAMHVYSFPIRVVPNPWDGFPDAVRGTLFPSTLMQGIDDIGFDVVPGEYDALARFFFVKDSDIGFDYRVIVSLMPRGTMAHGILKLDEAKLAEIRKNTQEDDSAPE